MNLEFLSKKNCHPRDKQIVFDEGPHIYYINGDPSFTSVTTWLGKHFPHFDADKVIEKMMKSRNWSNSRFSS